MDFQTILSNGKEFLNDLSVEKFDVIIKRETKTSNPIVFVSGSKKLSFVAQNEKSEKMSKSVSVILTKSYLDGLARYFSNEITNSDLLYQKLMNEKSIKGVSFL